MAEWESGASFGGDADVTRATAGLVVASAEPSRASVIAILLIRLLVDGFLRGRMGFCMTLFRAGRRSELGLAGEPSNGSLDSRTPTTSALGARVQRLSSSSSPAVSRRDGLRVGVSRQKRARKAHRTASVS